MFIICLPVLFVMIPRMSEHQTTPEITPTYKNAQQTMNAMPLKLMNFATRYTQRLSTKSHSSEKLTSHRFTPIRPP